MDDRPRAPLRRSVSHATGRDGGHRRSHDREGHGNRECSPVESGGGSTALHLRIPPLDMRGARREARGALRGAGPDNTSPGPRVGYTVTVTGLRWVSAAGAMVLVVSDLGLVSPRA